MASNGSSQGVGYKVGQVWAPKCWYVECNEIVLQPSWVGSWMWPCWTLIIVPNCVVLVLRNEGGILIICKVVIHGIRDQCKELVIWTLNIHQIFD